MSTSPLKASFHFFLFLISAILIQLPIIFQAGTDHPLQIIQIPLYKIFNTSQYTKLINKINGNKYIEIVTDENNSFREFINYYANYVKNNQNKTVVKRQYKNHKNQQIYKWFRFARNFIQDYLQEFKEQERQNKIFAVLGLEKQIPKNDILTIIQRFPESKIILITSQKLKIEKFKSYPLPILSAKNIQEGLQNLYNLSQNNSNFLVNFYTNNGKNLLNIFNVLNTSQFSIKQHLGQNYKNISKLNPQQKQILHNLCQNGVYKLQNNKNVKINKLLRYGVILADNEYHWKNNTYVLNYALQSQQICQLNQLDKQLLLEHENTRDIQQELQEQAKQWQNLQNIVKKQINQIKIQTSSKIQEISSKVKNNTIKVSKISSIVKNVVKNETQKVFKQFNDQKEQQRKNDQAKQQVEKNIQQHNIKQYINEEIQNKIKDVKANINSQIQSIKAQKQIQLPKQNDKTKNNKNNKKSK